METLMRLIITVVQIGILSAAAATAAAGASQALPGCEEWCGDVQIPYPFGMKEGCYLNEKFFISCNKTHNDSPKAFLQGGNLNVTNISISGELNILHFWARDCYPPNTVPDLSTAFLNTEFAVSSAKNKFTVIGCDTFSFISGLVGGTQFYKSACVALCDDITTVKDGACSGNGCCQLEIPKGLNNLNYTVSSFDNHTNVLSFNPCGYAFVIEEDKFNFSSKYIRHFPLERVPLVLDWAISNNTCENTTNCICGPSSQKVNFVEDGSEYRCQCSDGFEGNPYLPRGCQGK